MDNAKAIDLLDNLIGMIDDNQNNDYDAAFRMAIDALKTQLYREDATSDLISRQAAIDAVIDEFKRSPTPAIRAKFRLEALPSAQPEQRWIPCSERYPDMDERVLVYTGAHEYHVWDCMSNRADNYFWEDEEGLYRNKYEASLWMPLPEPYRGGDSR